MKRKELEEYFKSDKPDWYHIDNKGYKEWDTKNLQVLSFKNRNLLYLQF